MFCPHFPNCPYAFGTFSLHPIFPSMLSLTSTSLPTHPIIATSQLAKSLSSLPKTTFFYFSNCAVFLMNLITTLQLKILHLYPCEMEFIYLLMCTRGISFSFFNNALKQSSLSYLQINLSLKIRNFFYFYLLLFLNFLL